MDMRHELFDALIAKHKNKFSCSLFYGVPIDKLEANALRAIICELGDMQLRDREERGRERRMLNLFIQQRSK